MALLCLAATRLSACGPSFPNNLLDLGDNAVLLAPVAEFEREIQRMKLAPVRFRAVPVPNEKSFSDQTADAEMGDLRSALRRAKVPRADVERICFLHQAERAKLKKFLEEYEVWAGQESPPPDERTRPKFPPIELTPGLPGEFVEYFAGALAWHNPALTNKDLARESWERLLARPAGERRFKSTWAAFMLGKSWDGIEPAKAVKDFRQVRELARSGFADSLGLAAASYGLEARAHYLGRNYGRAIELYLEQLGTGDDAAMASLREVAAAALADPATLPALATNSLARQVITAQAISDRNLNWNSDGNTLAPTNALTGSWLAALEEAGVDDVESAERLAVAAYQAGAFDMARRWVARAGNAPVAQWIQAKLLLRAGKTEQAATVLAKVTKRLPVLDGAEGHGSAEWADELFMKFGRYHDDDMPVRRQVLGELGVIQMSRGEFSLALDALLRAGFWQDAAYVAERVLTVTELKDYVDRNWPQSAPGSAGISAGESPGLERAGKDASAPRDSRSNSEAQESETPATAENLPEESTAENTAERAAAAEATEAAEDESSPTALGQRLRYLLARRLTRENLGHLSREYYPLVWRTNFDALATALIAGRDETLPGPQRGESLFMAAGIARRSGMELLGTELQPDWHVYDGRFEEGLTWQDRSANERHARINVATAAEIQRASQHNADPERRFHYRYQAAFLALEAAKLMPNHSDDTARVLWTAGSWLKNRDPQTADIFYKALVRRCRKTELGAAADLKRWFPELDDEGHVLRESVSEDVAPPTMQDEAATANEPAEEIARSDMSDPSDVSDPSDATPETTGAELAIEYVVHSGDTLTAIARGLSVSIQDLLVANPGLEPNRLRVGQKIMIPANYSPR